MTRNQSTSLGDQLRKGEAEKMGGEWEEKRWYPFGTLKKSTDHRTQASMLNLHYAFAWQHLIPTGGKCISCAVC